MAQKIRAFVAVSFSPEVLAGLCEVQARLKRALPQGLVKWVSPGSMHLTLQFLGDVDPKLVPTLSGALRGAFSDLSAFDVHLAGVGSFPRPSGPRVLWAGFQEGAEGLHALTARTQAVTAEWGFEPEERAFHAHVTLGRLNTRERRPPDLTAPLQDFAGVEIGQCQIGVVSLFESELRPAGPVYTQLDSFRVGG